MTDKQKREFIDFIKEYLSGNKEVINDLIKQKEGTKVTDIDLYFNDYCSTGGNFNNIYRSVVSEFKEEMDIDEVKSVFWNSFYDVLRKFDLEKLQGFENIQLFSYFKTAIRRDIQEEIYLSKGKDKYTAEQRVSFMYDDNDEDDRSIFDFDTLSEFYKGVSEGEISAFLKVVDIKEELTERQYEVYNLFTRQNDTNYAQIANELGVKPPVIVKMKGKIEKRLLEAWDAFKQVKDESVTELTKDVINFLDKIYDNTIYYNLQDHDHFFMIFQFVKKHYDNRRLNDIAELAGELHKNKRENKYLMAELLDDYMSSRSLKALEDMMKDKNFTGEQGYYHVDSKKKYMSKRDKAEKVRAIIKALNKYLEAHEKHIHRYVKYIIEESKKVS